MQGKTRRPGELPPLPQPRPGSPPPSSKARRPLPHPAVLAASSAPAHEADPEAVPELEPDPVPDPEQVVGETAVDSASPVEPLEVPPSASIGMIIAERYKLVDEIGSGGMAKVYRAEHLLLRKPVAVKILLPELSADEQMTARFEREAVAAARLDHPNCVCITDFGKTEDKRLFLVMEYLDGAPLSEMAGYGRRLEWERAVDITRQILRGLARAHEMGIVHRDLKPSNVMVTTHTAGRDIAKIIDFGIAKVFDGTNTGPRVETQGGVVFGTADFLAPERLLGKGDADPRSDLYAVGVILYEMLTGERPFHSDDPYIIVRRALVEAPTPPSKLNPKVPPLLEAAVLRALEKDPERRYTLAHDFLAALDPLGKKSHSSAYMAARTASSSATRLRERLDVRTLAKAAAVLASLVVIALVVTLLAQRGSSRPVTGMLTVPPARPPDVGSEIAALVAQAGTGDTVEDRQHAFDRLVALGYRDRVPWVDMLSRDLEQLPTCVERRQVALQLKKLNDSAAEPALQKAIQRKDNACFQGDAAAASAPPAGPAAATVGPAEKPKTSAPRKPSSGGGHF